jgi:hypothetical protein
LSPTVAPTEPGFDFGSGCAAGEGDFVLSLPTQGMTKFLPGEIPEDKYNVFIRLEASDDLDVALYDTMYDEGGKWPETGKAIVAWCGAPSSCNAGLLGFTVGAERAVYQRPGIDSMDVTYSGYNGVNGEKGNEFIYIDGKTTASLKMSAFAYQAGSAHVFYSWGKSESGCCTGTAECFGVPFSRFFQKDELVTVGVIPVGKVDVRILLTGDGGDIDVQLYDTLETSRFPEGKAIIGWCPSPQTCNWGLLAGSSPDTVVYEDVEYRYSGYMGQNGNPGQEYIHIIGTTNRPLLMKAFGYTEGSAEVTYSYYEQGVDRTDVDELPPIVTQAHQDLK